MSRVLIFLFIISVSFLNATPLMYMRWYNANDVIKGKELFLKYCASCHGQKAEKTIKWKKRLKDGSLPPPPLNGTAHASHHTRKQLREIISIGGALYDGNMPGFSEVLTKDEIDDTIAYFQDFWSEEMYIKWIQDGGLDK